MKTKNILLFMTISILIIGCASSRTVPPPPPPTSSGQPLTISQAPPDSTNTPTPPAYSQTSSPAQSYPITPLFYDFEDIPIPQEMDIINSESRVFHMGQFKAGVLVFKGRVEPNSLVDFFQVAMTKEKWQFKSGFRYNKSVLIFEKPPKNCVIIIYPKLFYTYLEIYVAPSQSRI